MGRKKAKEKINYEIENTIDVEEEFDEVEDVEDDEIDETDEVEDVEDDETDETDEVEDEEIIAAKNTFHNVLKNDYFESEMCFQ